MILTRKAVAKIDHGITILTSVARRTQTLVRKAHLIDTQSAVFTHMREAVVDGELAETARETVQALTHEIALDVYARSVVEAQRHSADLTFVQIGFAVDTRIAFYNTFF